MVNLTQRWAEAYMKIDKDLSIQVTGGGSGTGVAALLNGTASVANLSRELKKSELKKAGKYGLNIKKFIVALDGIAVIVNPENDINQLNISQLRKIFSGEYTNWKQAGGADHKIVLYSRENSSGTYETFKQRILGKDESGKQIDFSTSTQVLQGTAALGEAVSRDRWGIGYGGVGYFAARKDLKIIAIEDEKGDSFSLVSNHEVNKEIIRNRDYPLSRELYCYTRGMPEGALKDYLAFISSTKGQIIVDQMEYIPIIPVKN